MPLPQQTTELTPKQKAFVDFLVTNGGSKQDAAEAAGYAPGPGARAAASKALSNPKVQQYLQQRIIEELGNKASVALHRVVTLAESARSEHVQLEAAKDILDRAGFKPIERQQVQVAGDVRVSIDLS